MTVYVCLCVFAMILYSLEHEAFESPASSAWATSKWDSSDNRQSLETKQHMAGKENILDRIIEIRLFLRVISKFPKWSSEVHHQNVMCECGSTPCTLVKMTKGNSIAVIKIGIPDTPKLPLRWGKWWQTMRYIGVSYFQIFLKYYDNPKKVVYAASFKAFEILLAMSQPPKPHQGPQLWLEAQRRNWSSNCRWRLQGNFSAFWHFRYSSTKDIE